MNWQTWAQIFIVNNSTFDALSSCPVALAWKSALSALFKVDGALRRVGGENDYICYAGNCRIHKILKK